MAGERVPLSHTTLLWTYMLRHMVDVIFSGTRGESFKTPAMMLLLSSKLLFIHIKNDRSIHYMIKTHTSNKRCLPFGAPCKQVQADAAGPAFAPVIHTELLNCSAAHLDGMVRGVQERTKQS